MRTWRAWWHPRAGRHTHRCTSLTGTYPLCGNDTLIHSVNVSRSPAQSTGICPGSGLSFPGVCVMACSLCLLLLELCGYILFQAAEQTRSAVLSGHTSHRGSRASFPGSTGCSCASTRLQGQRPDKPHMLPLCVCIIIAEGMAFMAKEPVRSPLMNCKAPFYLPST